MTHTFVDKKKQIQHTVLHDFLKNCPNPEEHTLHDLIVKFQIPLYWHNENGPAIVGLNDKTVKVLKQYFISPKVGEARPILDEEVIKKMQHNADFNDKFDKLTFGDETKTPDKA